MPRLYVASYFGNGPMIELTIRPAAESRGLTLCSTWHVGARGPESLDRLTEAQIQAINDTNDRDLEAADGVLVITHEKAAQTYAELARANWLGKVVAVNTCARDLPEAHRAGVTRWTSSLDALTWLAGRLRDRLPTSAEPDFSAVFKPSDRPVEPARGNCSRCLGIGRLDDRGFQLVGQPYFDTQACGGCGGTGSAPGPDTLPARADEEVERELAAGGGR